MQINGSGMPGRTADKNIHTLSAIKKQGAVLGSQPLQGNGDLANKGNMLLWCKVWSMKATAFNSSVLIFPDNCFANGACINIKLLLRLPGTNGFGIVHA